jgi:hypothetical protein
MFILAACHETLRSNQDARAHPDSLSNRQKGVRGDCCAALQAELQGLYLGIINGSWIPPERKYAHNSRHRKQSAAESKERSRKNITGEKWCIDTNPAVRPSALNRDRGKESFDACDAQTLRDNFLMSGESTYGVPMGPVSEGCHERPRILRELFAQITHVSSQEVAGGIQTTLRECNSQGVTVEKSVCHLGALRENVDPAPPNLYNVASLVTV